MTSLDDLQRIAEHSIVEAFPAGTPPKEDELCEVYADDYSDDFARRFGGKHWPEVTGADLTGNPELVWLRAGAFQYYLPALMLLSMQDRKEVDCMFLGVVGELAPHQANLSGRFVERLGPFTPQQAGAILAFLRFLAAREQADWSKRGWPPEAVASVPIDKVVARAIRYWSGRAETPAAE